jgi:hypothetical protein
VTEIKDTQKEPLRAITETGPALVQRWPLALIPNGSAPVAVHQQRQLLCLNKSKGQVIRESLKTDVWTTAKLKRVRVKQKDLDLPEPSQFKELAANLRKHSGG